MGEGRFNRRFMGIVIAVMALIMAACAESSLPSPTGGDATAQGGGKSARSTAESAASADSIIRLADASRAAGDRITAISLYHRGALSAPEDSALQIKAGFMLHELGAFAEADGAFRRALVVAPGNAEALRGLGITLVARDMPHHAIARFEAAIAAGADPRAYNALGVARDMTGNRAAAQDAYMSGLERDPENLTLLNNLGLSLALSGQLDEAISVLGRVTASPNATPRHRQNLALAYGLAGRPDLAADVSNNDLAMRDVQNNLGYYAWLRDRPAHENNVSATLSPPATAPSAGTMTAEAGAIAPPPPLAAASTVFVEEGAAEDSAPLAITPLAKPATGAQTADTASAGEIFSGDDTVWELTETVDQTPAKAAPKNPAGANPAAAAPTAAGKEGANAAIETARADAAASTPPAAEAAAEPAASGADMSRARLPDEIAHAIIAAPASAPTSSTEAANTEAANKDAAFDGSAYSRRLEGAPEIAFEDTPESDGTALEAESATGDEAPNAYTTAVDMSAEDWAAANRVAMATEAESETDGVAAPSAQLAMLPEDAASDTAPEDTASDVAPGMTAPGMTAPGMTAADTAGSDSEFTAPWAEVEPAPAPAARDGFHTQTARAPHSHAAPAKPTPAPAATADTSAATGEETASQAVPEAMPESVPQDATPAPTDRQTEIAQGEPEPESAADTAEADPATQSADFGQNGNESATAAQAAEPGQRSASEYDGVATTYPYVDSNRDQLARNFSLGTSAEIGPADPSTRMSDLKVSASGGAAALSESGPNVVKMAALGAAMFLIVALLALGRMRRRTGVPEPE